MESKKLDEESKALLRRIIESQAARQLAAIDILGHGLRYLTDIESKRWFAEELVADVRIFREVEALYAALGWTGIEQAVREKRERVPFPGSRQEFGLCWYLLESAERAAMATYVGSASGEFAAVARSYIAQHSEGGRREEERFAEYCADRTNLPHAQQMLDKWLRVTLLSLGRPGTLGDARAVALGLRSRPVAEVIRDYLESIDAYRRRCALALPNAAALGIELPPPTATGARRTRRS